ncbi:MAG: ribonuclease HI family protein [Patescibacteria group bacterium]|nr:ribonuclease HI family protein [Patescibacteria group bacterium]
METIICYTDGGARGNPGPAGAGAVITQADGTLVAKLSQFLGNATNNFAEYAAVILALHAVKKQFGGKTKSLAVEMRMDSELVARQLSYRYQIKEPSLVPQFIEIHNMRIKDFPRITFTHVPRAKNKEADRLANDAMDRKQ